MSYVCSGVVVAFVASPVMFMAASATLGLATGVQKLCEDLEPPDYPVIRGVADNPSVWGSGLTLVGLVTREETDAAVNLSIYHSLRYIHTCSYIMYCRLFLLHCLIIFWLFAYSVQWMCR